MRRVWSSSSRCLGLPVHSFPSTVLVNRCRSWAGICSRVYSVSHFLDLCKQVGVEPKVLYRVGEVGAVHRLVGRNKCAGLSVETVAEALRTPDTVAIPFEDSTFRWTVDLFKRKGAELSVAGTAFWNFFRDHLEQTV